MQIQTGRSKETARLFLSKTCHMGNTFMINFAYGQSIFLLNVVKDSNFHFIVIIQQPLPFDLGLVWFLCLMAYQPL